MEQRLEFSQTTARDASTSAVAAKASAEALQKDLQASNNRTESLQKQLRLKEAELERFRELMDKEDSTSHLGQEKMSELANKLQKAKEDSQAKLLELAKDSPGTGSSPKAFGVSQSKPIFGVRRSDNDKQ